MNPLLAGLVAALPVGLISGLLLLLRSKNYLPQLKARNAKIAGWDNKQITIAFSGGATFASLGIGLLAGWIYDRIAHFSDNAPLLFLALALVLAFIATLMALISKKPLRGEKIMLNFVFAMGLGILIPLLV